MYSRRCVYRPERGRMTWEDTGSLILKIAICSEGFLTTPTRAHGKRPTAVHLDVREWWKYQYHLCICDTC